MLNEGGGWALIMLFVLVPNFAPLVASYVRWGAVPISIGLTIGVYMTIIALINGLNFGFGPDLICGAATFIMFCICIGCHVGLLLRIQALGAK